MVSRILLLPAHGRYRRKRGLPRVVASANLSSGLALLPRALAQKLAKATARERAAEGGDARVQTPSKSAAGFRPPTAPFRIPALRQAASARLRSQLRNTGAPSALGEPGPGSFGCVVDWVVLLIDQFRTRIGAA